MSKNLPLKAPPDPRKANFQRFKGPKAQRVNIIARNGPRERSYS